jgi:hypothetical protein
MDGAYAHLAACYKRTTDHCIAELNGCLTPGAWLKSSCLAGCFFSGIPTEELRKSNLLKLTVLVAACSSALITAFDLQGKSADIWHAFRHLEQAILEHEYNASIDTESLLRAYKESEDIVGFFEFKESKVNK